MWPNKRLEALEVDISNMRRCSSASTRWLVIISLVTILLTFSTICLATNTVSGWTEVTKDWPLSEEQFFIAAEKGHHFIEVKLPSRSELNSDIELEFEYYYSYERTKPIISLVPCRSNIDVLLEETSSIKGYKSWNKYNRIIKLEDCLQRPELAFHIILHDEGDIFSWKLLKLKSAGGNSNNIETELLTNAKTSTELVTSSYLPSESTTITRPNSGRQSIKDLRDQSSASKVEQVETSSDKITQRDSLVSQISSQNFKSSVEEVPYFNSVLRARRSTDTSPEEWLLSCSPKLCDRDVFMFPTFMIFSKKLPPVHIEQLNNGMKYYIDTSEKPLLVHLEKGESNSDLCFELELFIEPDSEVELKLREEKNVGRSAKSLEIIRPSGVNGFTQWNKLKRCMRDYVPEALDGKLEKYEIEFIPRHWDPQSRIAILLDEAKGFHESFSYPTYDFIPNIHQYEGSGSFNNFWIVDKSASTSDPTIDLSSETFSGDLVGNERILTIGNIDPTLHKFDITSRWLRLNKVDTLERPVIFLYHVNKDPWIQAIEFEFQKGSSSSNNWMSRTIYEAPMTVITTTPMSETTTNEEVNPIDKVSKTTSGSSDPSSTGAPGLVEESPMVQAQHTTPTDTLVLPIKMNGLPSEDFRVRVRHIIKPEFTAPLKLTITSLAFGDLCADQTYCKNGGTCIPTGTAAAACTCKPGYYGKYCQIVKPCKVLYNGKTGQELCITIGAQCVEGIPEIRCRWPDDQYYQCRALYQVNSSLSDETDNLVPISPSGSSIEDLPLQEQVSIWKERSNNQTQTVIIMSVFLIALFLFSAVILGNMIIRLTKSKRKLKDKENEMQDLAYRMQPSTSTSARGLPVKPLGVKYNNQAFDVE